MVGSESCCGVGRGTRVPAGLRSDRQDNRRGPGPFSRAHTQVANPQPLTAGGPVQPSSGPIRHDLLTDVSPPRPLADGWAAPVSPSGRGGRPSWVGTPPRADHADKTCSAGLADGLDPNCWRFDEQSCCGKSSSGAEKRGGGTREARLRRPRRRGGPGRTPASSPAGRHQSGLVGGPPGRGCQAPTSPDWSSTSALAVRELAALCGSASADFGNLGLAPSPGEGTGKWARRAPRTRPCHEPGKETPATRARTPNVTQR